MQLAFLANLKAEGYNIEVSKKNRGTYQNVYNALTTIYNKYNSDYIIYIQDDVELSKNWYSKAVKRFDEITGKYQSVALLSLCNLRTDCSEPYVRMTHGHPGGVAWIMSRQFWRAYIDMWPPKYPKRKHLADWAICSNAKQMGYKIFQLRDSLVKHIGATSSIPDQDGNLRDMSQWTAKNYREE
jgi:hypothetical protein